MCKYYTAYVSKMSKNISFVENMNFKVVYTNCIRIEYVLQRTANFHSLEKKKSNLIWSSLVYIEDSRLPINFQSIELQPGSYSNI